MQKILLALLLATKLGLAAVSIHTQPPGFVPRVGQTGGAMPPMQDQAQFVDPAMTYTFGESIRFSARLIIPEADDPAQPATDPLVFISAAGRDGTFTDDAAYNPATGEVSYVYTVQPGALTPFGELSYQFQVTLADGSPLLSPMFTDTYTDTRFRWQEREEGPVTVHWYNGGADFARQASEAARAGLARILELLPGSPSEPVDIYIYASPADLQTALGSPEGGWIAGEAVPEQGAVFVSVAPSPEQRSEMERQIPHELAHIVLYRLAGASWANQPAWLREGIASQAELNRNPDYAHLLETETLIPLVDLCAGFPSESGAAFLAYAEADSFIGYLRAKYGASGLEALTHAYSDGLDCEQGPGQAFGLALRDLEQDWLTTLTAAPAPTSPAADGSVEGLIPVLVLLGVILIVPLALAFSGRRRHER